MTKSTESRVFIYYLIVTALVSGAMVMVIEVLGSKVIGPVFGAVEPQRLAEWMRGAGPERLRGMEILLDDLTRGRAAATTPPPKAGRRR